MLQISFYIIILTGCYVVNSDFLYEFIQQLTSPLRFFFFLISQCISHAFSHLQIELWTK